MKGYKTCPHCHKQVSGPNRRICPHCGKNMVQISSEQSRAAKNIRYKTQHRQWRIAEAIKMLTEENVTLDELLGVLRLFHSEFRLAA